MDHHEYFVRVVAREPAVPGSLIPGSPLYKWRSQGLLISADKYRQLTGALCLAEDGRLAYHLLPVPKNGPGQARPRPQGGNSDKKKKTGVDPKGRRRASRGRKTKYPADCLDQMQNIRAKRSVPGSLIPGSPLYKWRS
ncbi:hypothetical protein AG1IA_08116 [Rhizoctonia solani AG-1 IA]|uniref:Uncharacterized protein n=1 Tax=Thanatephorus cucumeris (strain AG1-IA) TaxID=983506 RepID=L8WND7_THACA|nr:hypothetical protein AG1IA_08116 [Rhizoctonia solani AG-1 IA]